MNAMDGTNPRSLLFLIPDKIIWTLGFDIEWRLLFSHYGIRACHQISSHSRRTA